MQLQQNFSPVSRVEISARAEIRHVIRPLERNLGKTLNYKPVVDNITNYGTTSSPVVPASFNVTSPVKLVGRTRLGRLAINGKSKMAEPGEESNFSRKNTAITFRFYHLQ